MHLKTYRIKINRLIIIWINLINFKFYLNKIKIKYKTNNKYNGLKIIKKRLIKGIFNKINKKIKLKFLENSQMKMR